MQSNHKSNVIMTLCWVVALTVIFVGCSLIWAAAVTHNSDNHVKIQQIKED